MAHCVTKVELSICCDHLIDKDVGSKSDPLCVLLQNVGGDQWTEVRNYLFCFIIAVDNLVLLYNYSIE